MSKRPKNLSAWYATVSIKRMSPVFLSGKFEIEINGQNVITEGVEVQMGGTRKGKMALVTVHLPVPLNKLTLEDDDGAEPDFD